MNEDTKPLSPQKSLFPLPLTPFEQFMLLDDTADYPMTFPIEGVFHGRFRPEPLRQALAQTLGRHPLLTARVEHHQRRGPSWVPCEAAARPIDWAEEGVPLPAEAIDVRREAGLRVWVRESGEITRLGLNFHHCACDGIGGLQFLGDLLAHYAQQVSGPSAAKLLELDPQRLLLRDRFKATPSSNSNSMRLIWDVLREAVRVLVTPPLALEPAGSQGEDGKDKKTTFQQKTIEGDRFRRLRNAARTGDATLNDLLLRGLFSVLAARAWASGARRRDILRILMPTSLRQRGDEKMPAANALGYAFLTRSLDECDAANALLDSIRQETAEIRRLNLGVFFLETARWIVRSRWLARAMLRGKRPFATAVLTNVGDPARRFSARLPREQGKLICGDVRLLQLAGVPPLRRMTRLVVSAISYGGELTICLRCDPHTFAESEAKTLLDQYVQQLLQAAESGSDGRNRPSSHEGNALAG